MRKIKQYWVKIVKDIIYIILLGTIIGILFNEVIDSKLSLNRVWSVSKKTNFNQLKNTKDIIEADNGFYSFISLDKAVEFHNEGYPFVDARSKSDYNEGHIPGAVLLDFYNQQEYLESFTTKVKEFEPFVVYCIGVKCEDSELLASDLAQKGYTNIYVYKGGFDEWYAKGKPVEK